MLLTAVLAAADATDDIDWTVSDQQLEPPEGNPNAVRPKANQDPAERLPAAAERCAPVRGRPSSAGV
ncbi:hypothetical protein OV450_2972 [Actinobacteria bacterium OV450]|nr:hypothetical protein OV450_2972 [Actinobacteria bacterium OV450]